MSRLSTKAEMIARLEALDHAAKFHADLHAGLAAGLAVSGLSSDAIEAAIAHDHGEWVFDRDGRRAWRPTP